MNIRKKKQEEIESYRRKNIAEASAREHPFCGVFSNAQNRHPTNPFQSLCLLEIIDGGFVCHRGQRHKKNAQEPCLSSHIKKSSKLHQITRKKNRPRFCHMFNCFCIFSPKHLHLSLYLLHRLLFFSKHSSISSEPVN